MASEKVTALTYEAKPLSEQMQSTRVRVLLGVAVLLSIAALYLRVVEPLLQSKAKESAAARITPREIQQVLRQSQFAVTEARYGDSVRLLQDALKKDSQHLDLLLQLGMTHRRAKQFAEADRVYQQALQAHPRCMECLNNRAVNLLQAGDVATAVGLLKEVVEKKGMYAEAHLNLAIAYEKSGQVRDAIASYQQYLKLIPSNDSRPEPAMARERIRQLQEGL